MAQGAAGESSYQAASTKEMGELLRQIYEKSDWRADPNKQAERIRYYQRLMAHGLKPADEALVREQIAEEELRQGDSAGAIKAFQELRGDGRLRGVLGSAQLSRLIGSSLAIAYLRLGEQENCSEMHGQTSCIFPLQASAVHSKKEGAEGAVRELTSLLEANPKDYESQWLLNLAYMQLGKYPGGVPGKWLVQSSRFQSEADVGAFPDVAAAAGLNVTGHAGGAIMEDFDGDGLLDVLVSSSGPTDQMHFFHNNGDGTFSDRTKEAGLWGETGGLNLVEGDYNNDGLPDVLVLRGGWWGKYGCYPMSLLRNNGNGTFDDVTVKAGLLSMHPTQTAAWADFDNDGYLDIFVGHESSQEDPHPSQLFHNNRDGTFTDIAQQSGLSDLGFVKGVAWGDFNRDGYPDLYVSVMGGHNRLFRNDRRGSTAATKLSSWKFTDVAVAAGVDKQHNSFATWFFDFDNDGWPDVFVVGYSASSMQDVGAFESGKPFKAELPRLYRNNHDGTFSDVTRQVHLDRAILGMGANFGDLDNDGWLDIYLGTGESHYEALLPNRMFRNKAGIEFQDVTTSGGFGNLQKGHAISFGDIEDDGSEDVFEEMGGALPGDTFESVLYKNPGSPNHSISLVLEGVQTNKLAYGAVIDVDIRENGRERHIYRTVGYGSSFGGNPVRQHIGIGQARTASIKIRWPVSGRVQSFTDLEADRLYQVREDSEQIQIIRLRRIDILADRNNGNGMRMHP